MLPRLAAGCTRGARRALARESFAVCAGQSQQHGEAKVLRPTSAAAVAAIASIGATVAFKTQTLSCEEPAPGLPTQTPYPPKPQHYILRPEIDPRIDASVLIRYDPPEHLRTGASIIILPGGNYEECCWRGEGQQVAAWLANMGITAFVLRYRVLAEGHYWPAQLEDFEDTMRMVRNKASAWRLDKHRVGVIGFSAGGHLAATAAVSKNSDVRPDLQILVYPSIDVTKPEWWPWRAHQGFPPPEESPHLHVTAAVPPAFLTVSSRDGLCVAAENTEPYAAKLKEAGVEFKHVVEDMGKHGHGLHAKWTEPCQAWLAERGWIHTSAASPGAQS